MKWIKSIFRFWKTIRIILLYLVTILLVYFMFPREGKFKYEYSKNKPWMHETLVAPFNFPIYKPAEQVQLERDSLERKAPLFFVQDSVTADRMISAFKTDYNGLAVSMGIGSYVSDAWTVTGHAITAMLEEVYATGIIERHPVLENRDLDQIPLMVVRNSVAEELRYANLYTERSAYEYLLEELERINPGSRALLSRMNLNDYLRTNLEYDEVMTGKVQQARLEELVLTQGMVQSGQLIIARGVSSKRIRIQSQCKEKLPGGIPGAVPADFYDIPGTLLVYLLLQKGYSQ